MPTLNEAQAIYNSGANKSYGYLNGHNHKIYYIPQISSPLLNNQFANGVVYSNGKKFTDLLIAYDTFIGEIIARPKQNEFQKYYILLEKQTIDSVTVSFKDKSYTLEYIDFSGDSTNLENGFYEVNRHNNLAIFFKHKSTENVSGGRSYYNYKLEKYFKLKDKYHTVNTKSQLLNLFPEHKKEIKKQLKTFTITYKHLSPHHFTGLLKYIDSL